MKGKIIGYWILTVLTALSMIPGGIFDLSRADAALEGLRHLGYPEHVATVIGIWKILGGITILLPGFPRLKEWAYAGIIFDLTGAAVAHAAAGDPISNVLTPLVMCGFALGSWALRPDSRRLPSR